MSRSTRIDLHPGYVLHTRAYRDTSLLVDVFTYAYGKITLVAKRARNYRNNQRHLLQPFLLVLLSWQGKFSLKTLLQVESIENTTPTNLTNKLISLQGYKLYTAMYINELLTYLLPYDDPYERIFENYQRLLHQINDSTSQIEPFLRYFEFLLLDELGYGINFYNDANNGEDLQKEKFYIFIQKHGFVSVSNCQNDRNIYFPGKELINIQRQDFNEQTTRQTAKLLSRIALKPYLRGRELKSKELFK